MMPMGFSMAMRGTLAFHQRQEEVDCYPLLNPLVREPARARHGQVRAGREGQH
jgi:hypothetical protein